MTLKVPELDSICYTTANDKSYYSIRYCSRAWLRPVDIFIYDLYT